MAHRTSMGAPLDPEGVRLLSQVEHPWWSRERRIERKALRGWDRGATPHCTPPVSIDGVAGDNLLRPIVIADADREAAGLAAA